MSESDDYWWFLKEIESGEERMIIRLNSYNDFNEWVLNLKEFKIMEESIIEYAFIISITYSKFERKKIVIICQ